VVRQGDVLIDQVGGNTDAATDSFDRLTVAIKETKQEAALLWKDIAGPAAEALSTLISANRKIREALGEVGAQTIKSGKSYEQYRRSIFEAAANAGLLNKATVEALSIQSKWIPMLDAIDNRFGVLSEEEYRASLATQDFGESIEIARFRMEGLEKKTDIAAQTIEHMKKASLTASTGVGMLSDKLLEAAINEGYISLESERVNKALERLNTLVSGRLDESIKKFQEKMFDLKTKAEELREKIGELEEKEYLTTKQQEELEQLRGELGDTNDAIRNNATEHEEATKRIVFALLQQQAAADGLTQAEVAGLLLIAEHWGIVDETTAEVTKAISENIEGIELGELEAFDSLLTSILEKPSYRKFTFEIETVGGDDAWRDIVSPDIGGLGGLGSNIIASQYAGDTGEQSGGTFTVPGAFTNDSFTHRVSAGETVTVQNRGQQQESTRMMGELLEVMRSLPSDIASATADALSLTMES
jgi:hypothetical protein